MLILDQERNLPDTEFKVYAVLTGLFTLEQGRKGKISARDLAEAANVSRRSVQYAMDNLAARNLIHITPGQGPKPPTITLLLPASEKITGAEFAPLGPGPPEAV
jgi:DNA-binding transcriptional MocR family regulator